MGKTKSYIIEDPERLNRLAREQMKAKLLNDILLDMTICQLEEWNVIEYLQELKELIDSIINKEINK